MFFPAADRFLNGDWPEGTEVVGGTSAEQGKARTVRL